MKKVTLYKFDSKNFTKTGKLKKNATPHLGMTIMDTDDTDTKYNNDSIARAIRKSLPDIASITSPYFFTHITINTTDGCRYIVYETVRVAGTDLMTSPDRLLAALKEATCPDCEHAQQYGQYRCATHYDPAEDNARAIAQTGVGINNSN